MINIAELLKDCPEGTKLYSPLFGEVEFIKVIEGDHFPIVVRTYNGSCVKFTASGTYFTYYPDAECLLFPSKEVRTWEGCKVPVEPKFKVGDFIVNDYCRGRVTELTDDAYLLDTGQGIPFSCEHNVHLWTIQDAKDGDVLHHSCTASNGTFIFKGVNESGKIFCYCDYDSEDHFCIGQNHHIPCYTYSKFLHPATKEQRDMLFQKMREAGCEWDAEKKELRKIKHHYDINGQEMKEPNGITIVVTTYTDGSVKSSKIAKTK